jgi:hypothetical protein
VRFGLRDQRRSEWKKEAVVESFEFSLILEGHLSR